nr:fatty acid amide hydrolase-like isoform X2 [Ziziphus jujuba var. spinosa]
MGSVRIPSSLCGEVGLKAIFGCTDMEGLFCSGTLEIIGTIASTVDDRLLIELVIYQGPPCAPNLSLTIQIFWDPCD